LAKTHGSLQLGEHVAPVGCLAPIAVAMDYDPFSRPTGGILTPRASDMARLQRLHLSTVRLAREAPELLDIAEVVRGIEQSLINAMTGCLQTVKDEHSGCPAPNRSTVMRRFRRYLAETGDSPVYVPELCRKLRVPARTLRTICHEYLGMGPKTYLYLRRMHLTRRALRAADKATTSVTDVATRFGFWELGRFSVQYKSLFGESPSTTLRH
jgi:AraC-like DNA-binding protein